MSRWGGEIAVHFSSTVASSTTAASTSEEDGLHASLFLTTSASTSSVRASEEEGLHTGVPPRNVGVYLGGTETSSRPHTDEGFFGNRFATSHVPNDQDPLLFSADVVVVTKVVSNGAVPS